MKNLVPIKEGCPYLFLAPMEGVGDRCFRKAMASVGGFDEAVTEFIRVPCNAHIESLARHYLAEEIAPTPIAAQLMGSNPELMAEMAREIEKRGAPRIDLNCGCPSNTVTGKGAGSSLLTDPKHLNQVASCMVKAVSIPVTIKMRSGFDDTSLFQENLIAAQESGVKFLTLHPRTKVEGYGPPAQWELIAQAKAILKIPVVGNGDILTVQDAVRMWKTTGCDALMIGRGSVINPFLFHQIRAHFQERSYQIKWEKLEHYLSTYLMEIPEKIIMRTKINKMKQLFGFLFKANSTLLEMRNKVLTSLHTDLDLFLQSTIPLLKQGYNRCE